MKNFVPAFKDDKDRLITIAVLILSIFFYVFPSLITIFVPREYISESTYEISKALFNFELFIFLISLLFLVPIIGWIVGFFVAPVLMIWNIIVIIINLCAIAGNKELNVPEPYKFM